MTSTAIKRLTLAERGLAAWEAEQERELAAELEHESAQQEEAKQRLLGLMSNVLGIELDPDTITVTPNSDEHEEAWPFVARATVDDITFSTGSRSGGLWLVLQCSEVGCRAEVLRYVTELADIGRNRVAFQQCPECFDRSLAEDGRIPILESTPDDYITSVREAGDDLAKATAEVQRLADGRAAEKSEAIIRLIGTENPETAKPHSASSAEKVVESDEIYLGYRITEREAETERIRAKAHYDAVKLKATLAVGLATRGDVL